MQYCRALFIPFFALVVTVPALANEDSSGESLAHYQAIDVRINNNPLTAEALTIAFKDQIHNGAYEFNRKGIPGKRFVEATAADGSLVHIQGLRVDTGHWVITERSGQDHICYEYLTDPEFGSCFNIYPVGNCFYHYPLRDTGRESAYWTARTVIKGERPDCELQIS